MIYNGIKENMMRVEVIKTDGDTVKTITKDDKVITISAYKIDFKCKVGDIILIEEEKGEKNYYLVNGKIKTENKKPFKTKAYIIIGAVVLAVIGLIIAAIMIVPKIIEAKHMAELDNKLNSCLYDGYKKIYSNSGFQLGEIDSIKRSIFKPPITTLDITIGNRPQVELRIEEYDMALSCYNRYQVKDYQEKVDELESYKKEAETYKQESDLSTCVRNAQNNSTISDEELQRAENDMTTTIALLTRLSNGYQEEINCYEKYGSGQYESNISELRIKKSETDSYIESAKNSTINNGGSNYLYCTTNSVGNYTYTNCY